MKTKKYYLITTFFIIYFILLFILFHQESIATDSTIHSFWDSLWFSIVTLSTVGYGDFYPVSLSGRLIGLVFIIASVGIFSTIVGKVNEYFSEKREKRKMGLNGTKFENHIVIIGWDTFARQITENLIDAGQKVAIITNNKDDIDIIYQRFSKKSIFVLYTSFDNFDSFENVNINKSKIVHLNLSTDTEELVMILNLKKYYKNLEFVVVIDENHLLETFQSAGVTYTLSKNEFASKLIASYIFEPIVADYTTDLITPNRHNTNNEEFDIQQFLVTKNNLFLNKSYGELFDTIKSNYHSIPIGLKKMGGKLHKLPKDDLLIEEGDYVIFINDALASQKISSEIFKVKEGS